MKEADMSQRETSTDELRENVLGAFWVLAEVTAGAFAVDGAAALKLSFHTV
jgi:hypothetical protein